jgi:hypothetical protein
MRPEQVTLKQPEWRHMPFLRNLWNDPPTMEAVGGPFQMTDEQVRN